MGQSSTLATAWTAGPEGGPPEGPRRTRAGRSSEVHSIARELADPHDHRRIREELSSLVDNVVDRLIETNVSRQTAVPILPPTAAEIEALAHLAAERDLDATAALLDRLRARGVSKDVVVFELVPAVARRLGELWDVDLIGFAEVTVGIGTLQLLVRRLERPPARQQRGAPLVVLSTPPAEQHTLGVFVLGEWLHRDGWQVHAEPALDEDELAELVREEPVAALGLSVSQPERIRRMQGFLRAMCEGLDTPPQIFLGGTGADVALAEEIGAVYCRDPRAASDHLRQSLG